MAQVTLDLASIGDLDEGAAGIIIDKAIQRAVNDLDDRGDDKEVREVTIKLRMKQDDDSRIITKVEVKTTVPPHRTRGTIANKRQTNNQCALLFQQHDASNPNQTTIPMPKE